MPCTPLQLMRELAVMQERMNRAWSAVHDEGPEGASRGDWTPAVDMYQAGNKDIVLKAELPGLRRGDIDVTVDHTTLTIRGERRREEGVADEAYHRVERQYGPFTRSFTLPTEVDSSAVRAEYRDGVLTVRVPVREVERDRQIQVAVS
jgi:HSP20 family protein